MRSALRLRAGLRQQGKKFIRFFPALTLQRASAPRDVPGYYLPSLSGLQRQNFRSRVDGGSNLNIALPKAGAQPQRSTDETHTTEVLRLSRLANL